MPMQPQAVMGEDSAPDDSQGAAPAMDPRKKEQEQETVEIPLSALEGAPKPGAMIQMKVVSVDQNANCVYAVPVMGGEPSGPPGQTPGGSDSLAAEFNKKY
jgi:hypothetical protein